MSFGSFSNCVFGKKKESNSFLLKKSPPFERFYLKKLKRVLNDFLRNVPNFLQCNSCAHCGKRSSYLYKLQERRMIYSMNFQFASYIRCWLNKSLFNDAKANQLPLSIDLWKRGNTFLGGFNKGFGLGRRAKKTEEEVDKGQLSYFLVGEPTYIFDEASLIAKRHGGIFPKYSFQSKTSSVNEHLKNIPLCQGGSLMKYGKF